MPLPTGDMVWPPTDRHVQAALADWDAWYSSEPWRLAERYQLRGAGGLRQVPAVPTLHASQMRGGLLGTLARWFWGNPVPEGEKSTKVHIPLAGDIARTSSDLLFTEPPKILAGAKGVTQDRLDDLTNDGLHPTLLEGAEVCAALGGVYLRVVWDDEIADLPWIGTVAADAAVPEFSYDRLRAVTFWSVLCDDGKTFYRHLERHEKGAILHGLYAGTRTQLGHAVPLTERPETAPLAKMVDSDGAIDTGAPDNLTAAYVPNVRPARAWRHLPKAQGWGQSDYQGIEGIMDALDETWSSWMRDIRNGKGRVVVPNSMLDTVGPGHGASWNADKEIYSGLNMLPRAGDAGKLDVIQFDIRVTEHRDTCNELVEQAVRQAGYSGSTFGLTADGEAMTATEVNARGNRSMTTRSRKSLYWGPAVADITAAWLAVVAGPLFGVDGLTVEQPKVEFPDGISDSAQEIATTVQLLRAAEAASTDVIVRTVHPDWDDDQVKAEVALIHGEAGRMTADPTQVGNELPQPFPPDPEPPQPQPDPLAA